MDNKIRTAQYAVRGAVPARAGELQAKFLGGLGGQCHTAGGGGEWSLADVLWPIAEGPCRRIAIIVKAKTAGLRIGLDPSNSNHT